MNAVASGPKHSGGPFVDVGLRRVDPDQPDPLLAAADLDVDGVAVDHDVDDADVGWQVGTAVAPRADHEDDGRERDQR